MENGDKAVAFREREKAYELIQGGYDLHTHPLPSHVERALDDFALLREADELGMAGVMIKNHYESTSARAEMANRRVETRSARAYGSVTLNRPAGGLNPYAVESSLRMGGRMVWMPTRDSANSLQFGDMEGDFFPVPVFRYLTERENSVRRFSTSSRRSKNTMRLWPRGTFRPKSPSRSVVRASLSERR